MLLNATNLPTHVVSAVFKKKLDPRFIEPFTVTAKKGTTYTLNLPRELCTHPIFYVCILMPYQNSSHVEVGALALRKAAEVQAASFVSRHPRYSIYRGGLNICRRVCTVSSALWF